jgi:hypothetical protein
MSRSLRLLFVLLFAHACAPPPAVAAGPGPRKLQLCVANKTASSGQATVRSDVQTWRVMPGETRCKPVARGASGIRLSATSIGGGIGGALRWSDVWTPGNEACWRLTLYDTETAIRLVPCSFERERDAAAWSGAAADSAGWVQVNLHEAWDGFTSCGNVPTGWVNVRSLLTPEGAQIVAHELAHVQMAQEAGGCAVHNERRARFPLATAVDSESRAYCVSARVWSRQEGVPLEAAIWKYAGWLAGYGLGLTQAQAAEEIGRRCPAAT